MNKKQQDEMRRTCLLVVYQPVPLHIEEKMMKKTRALLVLTLVLLSGCMNMPTPSAQITGSYVSSIKYESFDCSRLSSEVSSLARRENQLISAQEQRIKSSNVQAFWHGSGLGDGIEASELANVRGEKEAVRTAIESKHCEKVASAEGVQIK